MTDISSKFILYGSGAIIGALPAIFIRKYIDSDNFLFIIGALIGYSILMYIYYKVFLSGEMGAPYVAMNVVMILVVYFAGILLLKEKITSYRIIGVVLAIVSIMMLTT